MSPAQCTLALLLVPFAVYVLVRVGSAAYFRSKADHDNQRGQTNVKR